MKYSEFLKIVNIWGCDREAESEAGDEHCQQGIYNIYFIIYIIIYYICYIGGGGERGAAVRGPAGSPGHPPDSHVRQINRLVENIKLMEISIPKDRIISDHFYDKSWLLIRRLPKSLWQRITWEKSAGL